MQVLFVGEGDYIKGSSLRLNVVETLIVQAALVDFAKNSERHPDDRKAAELMAEEMDRRLQELL